ncbi:hypothetical protein [Phenylobacterium sp.]|uniref:hypothetical protein n=1 Tax=Phenylobacterium sp. TaxID=1871053 RepID=UPI0025F013B3|nr:hypothetical protein [Phenylobacterium sp.]
MTAPAKLKKSETLEIRIPYPTKQAFMARCQNEGRSASEVLRAFIDGQVEPQSPRPARKTWRLIAGLAAAAAVGAVAVPSLARPVLKAAEFARLDANHDGVLSFDEYRRP